MSNVTVYAPDGTPIITSNGGGGGSGAQGAQGTQGGTGSQGITGSTSGFKYRFVVGTTPPTSVTGEISYNNNTNISLVTKLYIATTSLIAGTTIYNFAETWDDSTNPGDKGYITIMNDSTLTWGQANIFRITGTVVPSVSPAPPAGYSYYEVPVTYVGGSLSQPQGNSNITLTFTRTGDQGIQGVQGVQGGGFNQLQGTQGTQGLQGIQGLQGLTGAGYTQSQGTQGVQGVQGENGPTGSTGLTGSQGTQGPSGSGTQGSQGTIGSNGIQGPTGTQGSQGIQGQTGSGTQGATGTQGPVGPQGVQGPIGSGVTSISTNSPITGGPITTTGTIGITQADSVHDGYLSYTDWNTFNNKQDVVIRQHEFVTGSPISVDYNGHAPLGSSTGDPAWTIYKLEINQDGTSIFYHADNNPSCKWDDRASISYSV